METVKEKKSPCLDDLREVIANMEAGVPNAELHIEELKKVVSDMDIGIEDLHNKITALVEISQRLIESDRDPIMSPGALCGFNNICGEVLEEFYYYVFKEKKEWH